MRLVLAVAAALLLAGCGASGEEGSPEEVAEAWVDAVNAQDWPRACGLSVGGGDEGCERRLARAFPDGDLRLERTHGSGGDDVQLALSTPAQRGEAASASGSRTAYAPTPLPVERRGGRYLVRFVTVS